MSRNVTEVLKSGYLTEAEKQAIDFEIELEDNENSMGEAAALAITCEQQGVDLEDYAHVLIELPDGDWWKAKHLPVKGDTQ